MHPLIILLIIGMVVAIALLSRESPKRADSRKKYLEKMVGIVEGRLKRLEHYNNSYQINFRYEGVEFSFEDIEEEVFKRRTHKGFLKAKTPVNLTLSFTEKTRTGIRPDISAAGQAVNKDQIEAPKALKEFNIYTDNKERTAELLADDRVVKVFAKFKTVGSRGYPVISLEIIEGVVTLKFHPLGNLKPNLINLQRNVSSIENYLEDLLILANKLKTLQD